MSQINAHRFLKEYVSVPLVEMLKPKFLAKILNLRDSLKYGNHEVVSVLSATGSAT